MGNGTTNILVKRSLKQNELPELQNLVSLLRLNNQFDGEAILQGRDPLLRSPHRLGEATAYALLLEGIAAAAIWNFKTRNNERQSLQVDIIDALHALHSTHFLWHAGYGLSVGAEFVPCNGIFQCRDGQFVMTEAGPPYVKLERGYLNFFDCGNNRESIGKAIAKFDALDLQEQLSALGLPASVAYTMDEWRHHPQGQHLLSTPVIEIERIAEGPPVPFPPGFPLEGIRVIDFTHVLAGPRSMRSLAQYGADVLHISSPYHRDTVAQNLLVNIGKRNAYLQLTLKEDHNRLQNLVRTADVFAFSYRPTVAEQFQITPRQLAHNHEGIVCLTVNAYGHGGPWRERPGFDHNVQVATGVARSEGGNSTPKLSPVFYLNDFLTGYLAAAGVMSALLRRATEGGSYHVKVSLARSAMWVQDLGFLGSEEYEAAPERDDYPAITHTLKTDCGEVTELKPPVQLEGIPRKHLDILRPFGADPAEWQT